MAPRRAYVRGFLLPSTELSTVGLTLTCRETYVTRPEYEELRSYLQQTFSSGRREPLLEVRLATNL